MEEQDEKPKITWLQVKNQFRIYLAELLLGWVLSLAPKNEEGLRLIHFIKGYFQTVIEDKK